jgi:hypothetical protein
MKLTKDELLAKMVDGKIVIDGDLELDELPWGEYGEKITNLYVGGTLFVRGKLDVRGDLYVAGDLFVRGNLYWSHASIPKAKSIKCKRVLPPEWQRDYWGKRLGISMDGCYDDILARILPVLDDWLKLDKWTPTERWMLESLIPKT